MRTLLELGLWLGAALAASGLADLRGDAGEATADASASAWNRSDEFAYATRIPMVLAPREATTLAAEVGGRVTEVRGDLGTRFEAGAILITLDSTTARAALTSSQARVNAAQAELAEIEALLEARTRARHAAAKLAAAQAQLETTEKLFADRHAAGLELERAKQDVEIARAECELVASAARQEKIAAQRELAAARAELARAQRTVDACTIRAPYAGRVARRVAMPHEWVQPSDVLLEVVDDSVLRAKFLAPSAMFDEIAIGDAVRVVVSETEARVMAIVSHRAAVLDAASGTFEVYAELDNSRGALRGGMTGFVELARETAQ